MKNKDGHPFNIHQTTFTLKDPLYVFEDPRTLTPLLWSLLVPAGPCCSLLSLVRGPWPLGPWPLVPGPLVLGPWSLVLGPGLWSLVSGL